MANLPVSSIKLIVGTANGRGICPDAPQRRRWYVDLLAQRHNQQLKEESKFFGYTARERRATTCACWCRPPS